ncbi:MAG: hypothetical protein KAR44_01075 [Candidatus Aegiribacteria sp.]|nr:hypothetical protein [Candidatus Aegiribacteria sp.]
MKNYCLVLSAITFLLIASCGSGGQEATDLHEQVELPQTSMTLLDSIGVELGDSCYVFGSIEGLGYTPRGDIAILDRISADIRLYKPDGSYLGRAGGRGSGPGEMHNPLCLFLFPDGRMGALDPWRNGLQIYSSEMEYEGIGMEISNNVHLYPEVVSDSSFISMKTEFIFEEGAAPIAAVFVGLFQMSIEPEVTYWRVEMELDFSILADLAQRYLLAVSIAVDTAHGIVYIAPNSDLDYRIERYTLDGEQLDPLELEVGIVALTEDEIRVEEEFIRMRLTSLEGGEAEYNVQLTDPMTHRLPVTDLEISPDGNLWARRGAADEPFFDIWSPGGELIGSVVLHGVGPRSRTWEFEVCDSGVLAYDMDPDLYQKIYLIGIAE